MDRVKITTLKNGLKVAVDEMPDINTVSVYLGVRTGSLSEDFNSSGISHFLEHMAFKGTNSRTALQVAEEVDQIGGYINAYTSRELTCYYVKLIDKYLENGMDIISDIIQNSIFDEKEIEIERGAILEEIAMYLDSPGDVNYNNFMKTAFGDSKMGMDIIGSSENVKKFTRSDLLNYSKQYYYPENMVLAITGNVKFDNVVLLAEKYFNKLSSNGIKINEYHKSNYVGGLSITKKKNLEQMQFMVGFEAPAILDRRNSCICDVLSIILGQGMSSRLFQEIREKRGLVYSVYSDLYSLKSNGLFFINLSSNPEKSKDFIPVLRDEILKISSEISIKELEKAKNQIFSHIVMSDESSNSRAARIISSIYNFGYFVSNEEILEEINSIKVSEILEMSKTLFSGKSTISVYYDDSTISKEKLNDLLIDNFKI